MADAKTSAIVDIAGVCVVEPKRFGDNRGFFSETFNAKRFLEETGQDVTFVQDNHSLSTELGVLRGLHAQKPPFAQAKLIRVARGRIWDVVIDARTNSPTYGKWGAIELSAENWKQLYIPAGCLHGFVTLEAECEVLYKTTNYYSPDHEVGVAWNDRDLNIAWPLPENGEPVLSGRDNDWGTFADFDSVFTYGEV